MDEEVNQDKNGEADGMNLEVDSKDEASRAKNTRRSRDNHNKRGHLPDGVLPLPPTKIYAVNAYNRRIHTHTHISLDGFCYNLTEAAGKTRSCARPRQKQEAQLSQRDRAMLRVTGVFAKSLKATEKWFHSIAWVRFHIRIP